MLPTLLGSGFFSGTTPVAQCVGGFTIRQDRAMTAINVDVFSLTP